MAGGTDRKQCESLDGLASGMSSDIELEQIPGINARVESLSTCWGDAAVGVEGQARIVEVHLAEAADHVEGALLGVD